MLNDEKCQGEKEGRERWILGLRGVAVLIGVAREGFSDVAFEKRPEGKEGSKPWECQRKLFQGWENSQCKGPEAREYLYVCGFVRGQGGWSLGMEGEKVVGEVTLGTKGARLGHDEELDLLDGSP